MEEEGGGVMEQERITGDLSVRVCADDDCVSFCFLGDGECGREYLN